MGEKIITGPRESVKIKTGVVNEVRKSKKETGVPISIFFEKAALEKLERENSKSKK